ncbi:hypothetical protein DFP72DRAFT_1069146 [Ephemerocybe angulata]|uniref:Uncharacterized protein n=1 Tax=Ephemerocybe angulata TaxID=980116 RepID=A0A8H6M6H6_9AGAR|nr:hypothetical protein DFP72DRAFT_1069146 [Tulosesus angulatus]
MAVSHPRLLLPQSHASLLSFTPTFSALLVVSLPWSSSSSSSSSWTTLSNDVLAVVVVVANDGSSSSSGFLVNVVDNGAASRSRLNGRGTVKTPKMQGAQHDDSQRWTYADRGATSQPLSDRLMAYGGLGGGMKAWGNEERDATTTMPMVRWECGVRSDTGKTTSGSDGHSTLRSLQGGRVG